MGHLQLALLGMPEVRHAGATVTFPTRKALGLLSYLAVEGGLHSREKLTLLFWPSSDAAAGRATLRSTVATLRNALQHDHGVPHLIAARDALTFDATSDVDLDLATLQRACAMARDARPHRDGQGDHGGLLERLQAAANLWRGEFLEGLSLHDAPDFDDWISRQRTYWQRCMSLVFDRLAAILVDGVEVARAIAAAARWVAHDPLNEAAYQRLMQVHLAAGDRSAALEAYAACRAQLAAELQIEPEPETEALAERIRRSAMPRPRPLPPGARREQAASPIGPRGLDARRVPGMAPLGEAPFVGRGSKFVALTTSFHAARQGKPQAVTLEGEAGIGKTRLAAEFVYWAVAQGADVLQGRAFETGGRLPYQPILEALRLRLERENAPVDLLSDIWLAELSRLLPELRDRYPDLPSPLPDEAGAQPRLFEAVARLLQALAERAPLLVVVDDLQWAVAASLDVLHYVCRRLAESRASVVLLIALRTEALAPQLRPEPPGLAAWLSGIQRDVPLTRLILEPLSVEETVSIVEALAQEAPRVVGEVDDAHHGAWLQRLGRREVDEGVARFGRWLFAETGGQPFFIFETLKALLEQGVLVERLTGDGVWAIDVEAVLRDGTSLRDMVPAGVRNLIRVRLDRLSTGAGALVAAAAILAHHSSFDLLCRVAGLDEHEGLAALDVALAAGFLRQVGADSTSEVEPVYVCAHDKVREVVYREVGAARRRSLHRRAFEALQAAHTPAAVLAHHALAAGLLEAGARLNLQAGDAALQLFAVRDAIAHYERARDLAGRPQVALLAMELLHIYLQLGRAYELNTEFEQARATYEDLLASAQAAQQPEIEWAALNRLATLAGQWGRDVDLAVRLLQQVRGTAERSGNLAGVAETEWNLAQLHFYAWDADAAVTHGERALALARGLDLRELVARSLNVLAYAKAAQDRLEEWGARAEESRVLYARLGNRAMEADCLCILADNQLHLGRPHAAIELARRAQVMTSEIENTWGQVYSALELAAALLEIGAYAEALKLVQQAEAIASAKGITLLHVRCLATLGAVHRALLDLEAARAVHHEALAISETITLWPYTQMIAAELCADYAEAGAWQAAYTYALHALPARRLSMWRYAGGFVLYYQTAALAHGGEHKQAQEDVRRFGERVGKYPRYRVPYLRALAVLAEEQGELRAAIGHLEQVAHLAEAIQIPDEQWRIQALLGDLYQRAGDSCRAREAFSRAAGVVRGLADQLDDAQLQGAFYARAQARRVLDPE